MVKVEDIKTDSEASEDEQTETVLLDENGEKKELPSHYEKIKLT